MNHQVILHHYLSSCSSSSWMNWGEVKCMWSVLLCLSHLKAFTPTLFLIAKNLAFSVSLLPESSWSFSILVLKLWNPNLLEAFQSLSWSFETLIFLKLLNPLVLKLWNPSHLEAFKPLVLKPSSPLSQSRRRKRRRSTRREVQAEDLKSIVKNL
jgi:hypothetical protein